MIIVSVMYPKTGELTFDMDYYLTTHTPLVRDRLSPLGLKSLRLMHGAGTLDAKAVTYHVIALLEFESMEALQTALDAHGAEIIGDIQAFTNATPLMQVNESL